MENLQMNLIPFIAALASSKNPDPVINQLITLLASHEVSQNDMDYLIRCAAQHGNLDVVQACLKANANIESRHSLVGSTALILAAKNRHTIIINLLLKAGANKDARNNNNETALTIAIQQNDYNSIKILKNYMTTFQLRFKQIASPEDTQEFNCPISLDLMNEPITLSSGFTYDRNSLQILCKTKNRHETFVCPVSRNEIRVEEIYNPVTFLINDQIETWLASQEEYADLKPPANVSSILEYKNKSTEYLEPGSFQWRLSISNYKGYIPAIYICPVSNKLMNKPITLPSGFTYDHQSLQSMETHNGRILCIMSKKMMPVNELNRGVTILIKQHIENWVSSIEPKPQDFIQAEICEKLKRKVQEEMTSSARLVKQIINPDYNIVNFAALMKLFSRVSSLTVPHLTIADRLPATCLQPLINPRVNLSSKISELNALHKIHILCYMLLLNRIAPDNQTGMHAARDHFENVPTHLKIKQLKKILFSDLVSIEFVESIVLDEGPRYQALTQLIHYLNSEEIEKIKKIGMNTKYTKVIRLALLGIIASKLNNHDNLGIQQWLIKEINYPEPEENDGLHLKLSLLIALKPCLGQPLITDVQAIAMRLFKTKGDNLRDIQLIQRLINELLPTFNYSEIELIVNYTIKRVSEGSFVDRIETCIFYDKLLIILDREKIARIERRVIDFFKLNNSSLSIKHFNVIAPFLSQKSGEMVDHFIKQLLPQAIDIEEYFASFKTITLLAYHLSAPEMCNVINLLKLRFSETSLKSAELRLLTALASHFQTTQTNDVLDNIIFIKSCSPHLYMACLDLLHVLAPKATGHVRMEKIKQIAFKAIYYMREFTLTGKSAFTALAAINYKCCNDELIEEIKTAAITELDSNPNNTILCLLTALSPYFNITQIQHVINRVFLKINTDHPSLTNQDELNLTFSLVLLHNLTLAMDHMPKSVKMSCIKDFVILRNQYTSGCEVVDNHSPKHIINLPHYSALKIEILDKLDTYIRRIDDHPTRFGERNWRNGQLGYQTSGQRYGFWCFKEARGYNRQINYNLALKLRVLIYQNPDKPVDQIINDETLCKLRSQCFHEDRMREDYIPDMGIQSSSVLGILKLANPELSIFKSLLPCFTRYNQG